MQYTINVSQQKLLFLFATGSIGSFLTSIFGEWTSNVSTLVIFMFIDYILGIMIGGIYQKSPKTKSGGLSSSVAFTGIIKKFTILALVVIAHRLDLVLHTQYIKDGSVVAFCCNELLSIIENLHIIGIPLPSILLKAIDILKEKTDTEDTDEKEERKDDSDGTDKSD